MDQGIQGMLPSKELIEKVRRSWVDVLGTQDVPTDVSFFQSGGNSLLLVLLHGELSKLAARALTLEELFRADTVRSQALLLMQA
ncbi:phosphopantetheine-binding protein [Streptomyces rhizosphaericus]|uniref:Acyl carrier protein n=1 Tax=Streptomyces rhizosphaericus TaxID=114699 RepID=A0A6G4AW73_9ACTN|nr:phosphopantetheine-binding protein [Streptomyces rhizosphaericus]NEW77625.1 acyl carrier protein [Streptomyces rhizosphaericus]